jgi:hypothetical protein
MITNNSYNLRCLNANRQIATRPVLLRGLPVNWVIKANRLMLFESGCLDFFITFSIYLWKLSNDCDVNDIRRSPVS